MGISTRTKAPEQTVIDAEPIPDFVKDFAGGDERLRKSMETVANQNRKLKQQNEELGQVRNNRAGAMLLVMIPLIVGRLGLYVYAEDWGRQYEMAGMAADVVFGGAAVMAIAKWIQSAWATTGMLMIPNAVLVYVSLELCSILILRRSHDIKAVAFCACMALIIGASPLFVVLIDHTLSILRNPFRYFGGDDEAE